MKIYGTDMTITTQHPYLQTSDHDLDRARVRGLLFALRETPQRFHVVAQGDVLAALWRLATNGEHDGAEGYELNRMADNLPCDDVRDEMAG